MSDNRLITLTDHFFDSLSKQKNKKLLWFEIYTLVFLVTFIGVFSPVLFGGRTFVWTIDGRYQMLPWLYYVGEYVRRIVECISQGNFPIPLYDLSMGWGDDIIGYLGSNGHAEPIAALLSAMFPMIQIEMLYAVLLTLRLYASGLTFLFMCRYFKKEPAYALAGALIYLFNGYTLFCGTAFSYFLNAMILLPLLIVGADRILRHKISGLFVFGIFYAGLCGFYLLYMLSALVAIFALVRFFSVYEKGERLRIFPRLLFWGVLQYCIGFGLAAPVLLPSFVELFSSARNNYNSFFVSTDLLTHWRVLWERVIALIAPKTYYEADWGVDFPAYAAVFLPSLALMFLKKQRKTLKWLSVIGLLTYFLPWGGWVMNGFQYSSNRWSFGLAMLAGYIVVEMLPELQQTSRRETGILLLLTCLYTVVGIISTYVRVSVFVPVGGAFLAISLLVVQFAGKCQLPGKKAICLLLVGINVCTNALYTLTPDGMNWIAWFDYAGNEVLRVASSMEADGEKFPFYDKSMDGRFDSSSFCYNQSMYFGIPGTLFYSSTYNGNAVRFLEEMEESGNQQNFKIHSTDQRTMMDTLLSVKYFLEREDSDYVPYGYKMIGSTYIGRNAYKNDYALPWGYTYNTTVSYDELDNLNGIQKQQALLQAAAIEDGDSGIELSFDEEKIPYSVELEDCDWSDGMLKTNGSGTIMLNAELSPGREYYLRLNNFDADSYRVSNQITSTWSASFNIYVECGDIQKYSRAESTQYTCYYGRKNYLFNLGCSDEPRNTVTITISASGTFGLDDIELYALPMTHYEGWVNDLREEPLENIQIETNRISGTVDISKNKILCLTIPYSKGWTAYVDGEKAEVLKANYAFMGLKLPKGHHEIAFEYFTPGLREGLIIGSSCFAVLLCIVFYKRKEKLYGKV